MTIASRGRVLLARHPWVYWAAVIATAGASGLVVHGRIESADQARRSWTDTQHVWVAAVDLDPDDVVVAQRIELPRAAVPPSAVDDVPDDARAWQHVGAGEIIVGSDLSTAPAPVALAEPGDVVVAMTPPPGPLPEIGLRVQVAAEGVVIAATARIVWVADDVVYVAVREADGPLVAHAAASDAATLLFVP